MLGLDPKSMVTVDGIDRAYKKALLEVHPDTAAPAGLTGETRTVTLLQQAREMLKKSLDGANSPCRQCAGRGRVPARLGTATCGACKGTGETTT